MTQRVIVTVMRVDEAWGRDLELPAELPAAQLSEQIARVLGWESPDTPNTVDYEIESNPSGRRLLPFETLAEAGVWDGAWLTLYPRPKPAPVPPESVARATPGPGDGEPAGPLLGWRPLMGPR